MPVINVKLWDIERLTRESILLSDLEELLSNLKAEVVSIEGDDIYVEVSHDRADLFSAEGIARAIRFWKLIGKPKKVKVSIHKDFNLDISRAPSYRPYAYLMIIRNVKLDDESIRQIFQLQEKLHVTYCDDRRLVSIGLYDLDKLKPPIRYIAISKASFRPLDHTEVMSLDEILVKVDKGVKYGHLVRKGEYPLLVDSLGNVLSLPPIINCEDNRVTESTKNILIDVTGTEPKLMAKIITLISFNVAERGYGKAEIELVPTSNEELTRILIDTLRYKDYTVKLNDIEDLIGVRMSIEEVYSSLNKSGYIVERLSDEEVKVRVPPYRIDVIGIVDIIEDIAIGYGYNKIGTTIYPPTHHGEVLGLERFSDIIRELMVGLGFDEVVNFMLIDRDFIAMLTNEEFIDLVNPKLKSYSAVRNSLIPSILLSIKRNADRYSSMKIFEIGDYVKIRKGRMKIERSLAYGIYGDKVTLTDGLIIVKSLMNSLNMRYELRETKLGIFIEGRAAEVLVNNDVVGIVGELHPEVIIKLGLSKPVVVGELILSRLYSKLRLH